MPNTKVDKKNFKKPNILLLLVGLNVEILIFLKPINVIVELDKCHNENEECNTKIGVLNHTYINEKAYNTSKIDEKAISNIKLSYLFKIL